MLNGSMVIFAEANILPVYDACDGAHDGRHIREVIARSLALAKEYGADENIAYIVAAYHDIGMVRYDRETHHITSARLLAEDERLRAWFDEGTIFLMKEAIEDHRASAKEPPRSLYGKIIADADREYTPSRILERTMRYGMRAYPGYTEREQLDRAYAHVANKYGESGYLKFHLPSGENEKNRREILALLADRVRFDEACLRAVQNNVTPMRVEKYLSRIGVDFLPEPTAENLSLLQKSHLLNVPYENMDIVRGVPLSLDRRKLYDKIVSRGRGGYCFELNELFGWLLRALGYRVTDYFARFLAGETAVPMRRHHVLRVTCPYDETVYLCDVGVGSGSPTCPVRLTENGEQAQEDATWRFTKDSFLGWVLEQYKRGAWAKVFSFTEEAQLPVDFEAASFYCEHSPASIFNKAPMISLRTKTGRVTLDNDELRVFDGGNVTVRRVDDTDAALRERFGIRLP